MTSYMGSTYCSIPEKIPLLHSDSQIEYSNENNDRLILEQFYRSTGGSEWIKQDNWLDDQIDICSWYGITCSPAVVYRSIGKDVRGFVTKLQLVENNLVGF
eukprot:CAMPEP_0194401030 /NCGR_PEP_ID=MMETSP0174-20130528/127571_1 /TAXON_ID=216777 /ORGANISM="Proboscia alata, Strain PI-D3" /LENGTH=100 /DNA_ID=CAMNT_0039197667 /DNA_START=890 /DNA_END=1189 /DNA_ORIENTATION=-